MSGVLHGIVSALKASAAAATDAFFEYVSLLLPGSGTNGAQNNTFLDASTNNFTITRNGNATQGTFSPYGDNWSNFFDGTGDYLTAPANAAFNFGTGDWTVECWFYKTAEGSGALDCLFANRTATFQTGQWYLSVNGTSADFNYRASAGSDQVVSGTFALDCWNHVAVVRNGTNYTMYLNGAVAQTKTISASDSVGSSTFVTAIGAGTDGSFPFVGYISNARIVKGTAVYTAAFTPPTAPLTAVTNTSLLTCQSNRFIDNSTNAFTITRNGDTRVQRFSPFSPSAAYVAADIGGSGYFDGTGDYLTLTNSTALQLTDTTAFTIECWVYLNSTANDGYFLFAQNTSSPFQGYSLRVLSGAYTFSFGTTTASFGVSASLNTWTHIAVTYEGSGTTRRFFVNGAQAGAAGTISSSINYTSGTVYIGNNNASNAVNGYISNLRIVKGTAVYTAAFTPPTAPLTAITNTSLLCDFTNAGVIDNAMMNDVETVGNAQISNAQAKWGSTSISFDGTGDWLVMPDSPPQRLGTGDFTIEGWLRINATGVAYGVISKGTATTGWSVNVTSGNKLQFSYTATQLTGATSLAANTWYHFAVVRNGTGTGNLKIYLDGTADATSAGAVTDNFNQTNVQYVGANRTGGDALNGYVQDARVTTGYARYTANFTAPTAAFPTS